MPPRTWHCCGDRSEERRGLLTCEVCGGNWLCQVVFGGHLFPPTWLTAGLCEYRRPECLFRCLPKAAPTAGTMYTNSFQVSRKTRAGPQRRP